MTGRWHDPKFSLRRQADLVKLARAHGVEELLPHTVKGTEERLRRRQENGLRVKGTGVGQRVKGKESERTQKGRYVQMDLILKVLACQSDANTRIQIGEEEAGYAWNACDDTRVEGGNASSTFQLSLQLANDEGRGDMVVDGRNGRNRFEILEQHALGHLITIDGSVQSQCLEYKPWKGHYELLVLQCISNLQLKLMCYRRHRRSLCHIKSHICKCVVLRSCAFFCSQVGSCYCMFCFGKYPISHFSFRSWTF